MRFVFLFIFALAVGHAHADGSGEEWQQLEEQQQVPEDYDEYYLEDDGQGNQTIVQQQQNLTIIDNSVTINNYVDIDVNIYPNAPAIIPMGPMHPPVHHCEAQPRPWGWTFYAVLFDGRYIPLAHVGDPGAYWNMRRHLYFSGQCPNP